MGCHIMHIVYHMCLMCVLMADNSFFQARLQAQHLTYPQEIQFNYSKFSIDW